MLLRLPYMCSHECWEQCGHSVNVCRKPTRRTSEEQTLTGIPVSVQLQEDVSPGGYHLSSCIASSSSCHCTSFTYTSLIHMLDYIEREGGVEGNVSFPTSILCLHRKLQKGSSISLFKTSNDKGFPSGSDSKGSACSAGDLDSVSGLGRSPGEGNDHSLQYSCLENSMDRGAWQATVHGVTKSQT